MTAFTLTDRIDVEFGGDRAGEAPLTLSQLNTFQWVTQDNLYFGIVEWHVDVPPSATLEDVRSALAILMGRHESLRTTFHPGDPPTQRVVASGRLALEVYQVDAPATRAADPSGGRLSRADAIELASELGGGLRKRPFRLESELPVRVAVAVCSGRPLAVAFAFSHMAVDFIAMSIVGRQFRQLISDPAARVVGPRAHQPLDQVAMEASPRMRSMTENALRAWERQIQHTPRCLYATSYREERDEGPWTGWLRSPAAALALPHITARTGGTRSMVVLAALFAVLSWRAGRSDCVFVSLASNRFSPRMRDYVGTLAQDTLVSLDTAAPGLDELIRRTGTATLRNGKHGLFDVYRLQDLVRDACYRRGTDFQRDCTVNNLLVAPVDDSPVRLCPPAEIASMLSESTLEWWKPPPGESLLRFDLVEVHGLLLLGLWTGDTGRIPREDIQALLSGVELVLVAAASGDVDLARIGEITGLAPIERGPDWLLVDGSWVELSEVQRLLCDALVVPTARVFAERDDDGRTGLVGYFAAGGGIDTVEQAHDACMAALPGRYTAITPGRYVMCDGVPEDPTDRAQWERRPVRSRGDGRRTHPAGSSHEAAPTSSTVPVGGR